MFSATWRRLLGTCKSFFSSEAEEYLVNNGFLSKDGRISLSIDI